MPQIKLKAKDKKAFEAIEKAVEETVIIQRQKSMTYGRWDFVVFGKAGKDKTILREGYAEHATIQRAPLYVASLAKPGWMDLNGVPIEEFITEDVPEEYQGLEVVQVDPVRPLTIQKKKTLPAVGKAADKICKEYEDQNIAVIQAPRDADWMISVIKYLHEFDRSFSDPVQESLAVAQMNANHLFSFGGRGSPDTLN
ncbi:MAG: hypothetical protein NPINA01_12660 [Nitrospinaceae bacterium]|nr:MAG: hypothetical protein NPINA01_12660 [Nitrospinaceae bacterium]